MEKAIVYQGSLVNPELGPFTEKNKKAIRRTLRLARYDGLSKVLGVKVEDDTFYFKVEESHNRYHSQLGKDFKEEGLDNLVKNNKLFTFKKVKEVPLSKEK